MMEKNEEPKYPYELFGIECWDGWKKLYQPIIDYLKEYNKDKEEKDRIEIHQIKEKFGSIRIYLSSYTDELRQMIDDAEEQSYYTCEICGKYITKPIVEHHWMYPMCKKCFEGMKEKEEKAMEEVARKIKKKNLTKRENCKD